MFENFNIGFQFTLYLCNMPNPIKYSTGSESDALKKGNMYIGTGSVGKGPSDVTGYYQGPAVPSGGYVIYMNKVGAPGGLSYHSAANDSELISFTNSLAGQNYTTAQQCFDYYYGQTDKVLVTQDYPSSFPYIVLDGLVLYLDAGISQSYSGSGTVWNDVNGLGPKNNGTLLNGPTFSNGYDGGIVFDGVDDLISFSNSANNTFFNSLYPNGITIMTWVYLPSDFSIPNNDGRSIFYRGNGGAQNNWWHFSLNQPANNPSNGIKMRWWIGSGNSYSPWLHYAETSLQQNTIYHFCLTWEIINSTQATTKMYLNGNVDYTNTANKNSGISLGSATILGNYPDNNWNPYFTQYNLMTYNRALTASEVLQNYNAQKGRFGL